MGLFSGLFSSAGASILSTVRGIIDDVHDSDEELALTDIQRQKIAHAYSVKMQKILLELEKQADQHEENIEAKLTKRLKIDMESDSWLSKNIRPLTVAYLTLTVSSLAFLTIFNSGLTETQLETVKLWVTFFQVLMVTTYSFYFGSRGIEKVQKMRSGLRAVEKLKGKAI